MATIPDNNEWTESITAISKTDPVRFDVLNKTVEQINSRIGWLRENTEPSFSEVGFVDNCDRYPAIESLPEGVFFMVLGDIEVNLSGGDSIAAGTEYHFCNAVESQVSFVGADIVSKGGTELVGDWHVCTLKKLGGSGWALFGDLAPEEPDEPALEGFVIKTTDGVVAVIDGLGEVAGTGVYVEADGLIDGQSRLAEVLSWPEEKPDWLVGNNIYLAYAGNLVKVPDNLPVWITDCSNMFLGCGSFNSDVSGWDVSNVTNMDGMFSECGSFNQDVSGWDVSNVTNMRYVFFNCAPFNQDISGWDVSNVTTMQSMFGGCVMFDQDISGWDVSSVTNMFLMFGGCVTFNQDISGWDVSGATNTRDMFRECENFNQDISGWDVSNVTNMDGMFRDCTSFNQDISGWNVANVSDMAFMFQNCLNFNQDLSGWCVSNLPSEPFEFSSGASSWTLPKPIWGTCP